MEEQFCECSPLWEGQLCDVAIVDSEGISSGSENELDNSESDENDEGSLDPDEALDIVLTRNTESNDQPSTSTSKEQTSSLQPGPS
ncbi:hypothetical protein Btru_076249 [Bulinus truncatus]|nr:hypothetical protein Btru_076249 [Bulinus truncatus]